MQNILIAFLVVAGVGLIAGLALALIGNFFGVEEDEKVKNVRTCLPGANCGACGYKGCDDYAAAIAAGNAAPNLCIPGGESTATELGELLGIEIEPPKDVVAFVACNGNCEATSNKATYDGISSCRAASMLYGGPAACSYGCLGLGDCAAVCPSDAICTKDGIAHVDTSRCIGCGACADTCPKHIIHMVPQESRTVVMCSNRDRGADARKVCKNACIACRKCEKTCPHGAITVIDNLARIDYTKCTGCLECVAQCPTGCLKEVFFPDLPGGCMTNEREQQENEEN